MSIPRQRVNSEISNEDVVKREMFVDWIVLSFLLILMLNIFSVSFFMVKEEGLRGFVPASFSFLIFAMFSITFFLPTLTRIRHLQCRILLVIAGTALATATLALPEHMLMANILTPIDWSYASVPRLFFFFGIVGGMLWTAHVLSDPVKQSIRRRWWNMGASDSSKAPEWDGILDMLCNGLCDPMELEENGVYPVGEKEIRIEFSAASLGAFFFLLSVGTLFGVAIDYVLYPRLPSIFEPDEQFNKLASLSGNLTAFLALIAAAVSIVFTYQQLRAKVRADSRQAWVTKVRKLTSNVLANIYDVTMCGHSSSKFYAFNKARTHLELHLNPAEKDHRLLMLLIRACAYPETIISNDRYTARRIVSHMRNWREDRKRDFTADEYIVLRKVLSLYLRKNAGSLSRRKAFIQNNADIIVSFIFKLSHSILKREWERVRYTR